MTGPEQEAWLLARLNRLAGAVERVTDSLAARRPSNPIVLRETLRSFVVEDGQPGAI